MERIWPAFQSIDTSSGALGAAVARTLNELIPTLIEAPADRATRAGWLERLFEATSGSATPSIQQKRVESSQEFCVPPGVERGLFAGKRQGSTWLEHRAFHVSQRRETLLVRGSQ